MGAVNLAIERVTNTGQAILPDPPASGYYTTGDLVETTPGSGLYVPTGLVQSGVGLYEIPEAGYSGLLVENLKDYSVQEDATTINAATYSGGFGQVVVNINDESRELIRAINDQATLSDPVMGKVTGTVRNMANDDGDITLTADSILGLFNADKVVEPFTGRFEDALRYYCTVSEIPIELVVRPLYDASGNIVDDIPNRQVTFPGWVGNVWDHLKEILVSQQVELSQVFDQIIVRPLRTIVANTERNRSFGWSIDNQTTSRQVQINYYPTERQISGEFYPVPNEEPTIYQVDAGEFMTFTLQLPHSLEYVNQPDCVEFVQNRTYEGTNGVYAVAGNDGLPIKPAQWLGDGGSLTVRLTEDPSVVEVTLIGASNVDLAPYRIAMTSGEFYNSMHLTGTGLFQQEESVVIYTGAASAVTGDDIGVVVQNRNIQSLAQALSVGAKVAGAYALAYTVRGEAFNLNRTNASREEIVATLRNMDSYNALNIPGLSEQLGDFNDLWVSFPQIDGFWQDYLATAYENQAFGNAAGARVLMEDNNFRIDSATLTSAGISYSGSIDTIVSDFNSRWAKENEGAIDGTNFVTTPIPQGSTNGWAYQYGTGEVAPFTLVTGAVDGPVLDDGTQVNQYLRRNITTAKTGGSSGWFYRATPGDIPLGAGEPFVGSMYVRASVDTGVTIQVTARNGTTSLPGAATARYTLPANTWVRVSAPAVSSGIADGFQIWATLQATDVVPAGGTIDVTGAQAEKGTALTGLIVGSLAPTLDYVYQWAGDVNNSRSFRLIGPTIVDSINDTWGTNSTINDFSLAALRRN